MAEGEGGSLPIKVLFNFWETRPNRVGPRLDALLAQGVGRVASFVPWALVESDITRSLQRFLGAAVERGLRVELVVTPEPGIHFPYSGYPRDLVLGHERSRVARIAHALDEDGQPYVCTLPPVYFRYPSLTAPEARKRYDAYLHKLDALLADVARLHAAAPERIELLVGGGPFRHLRPLGKPDRAAGDFAGFGASGDRGQRLDQLRRQEHDLRTRTRAGLSRKAGRFPIRDLDLFTPEAAPELAPGLLAARLQGTPPDLAALGREVARACADVGTFDARWVHWPSAGVFSQLKDGERQYLLLESLLSLAPSRLRRDGVLVDERDWFSLREGFRGRYAGTASLLRRGALAGDRPVRWLKPYLHAEATDPAWEIARAQLGQQVAAFDHPDAAIGNAHWGGPSRAIVLSPHWPLKREEVDRLLAWARLGEGGRPRLLVLRTGAPEAAGAGAALFQALQGSRSIDAGLAVPCRLHRLGLGVVAFLGKSGEAQAGALGDALRALWEVVGVDAPAGAGLVGEGEIALRVFRIGGGPDEAMFALNPSAQPFRGELRFRDPVALGDLSLESGDEAPGGRFALEVPPRGVLGLKVRPAAPPVARPALRTQPLAPSGETAWR